VFGLTDRVGKAESECLWTPRRANEVGKRKGWAASGPPPILGNMRIFLCRPAPACAPEREGYGGVIGSAGRGRRLVRQVNCRGPFTGKSDEHMLHEGALYRKTLNDLTGWRASAPHHPSPVCHRTSDQRTFRVEHSAAPSVTSFNPTVRAARQTDERMRDRIDTARWPVRARRKEEGRRGI